MDNSNHFISERDLSRASGANEVTRFTILQLQNGYYIVGVRLNYSQNTLFLTTKRSQNRPRLFADISRLFEHIAENYLISTVTVRLVAHNRLTKIKKTEISIEDIKAEIDERKLAL